MVRINCSTSSHPFFLNSPLNLDSFKFLSFWETLLKLFYLRSLNKSHQKLTRIFLLDLWSNISEIILSFVNRLEWNFEFDLGLVLDGERFVRSRTFFLVCDFETSNKNYIIKNISFGGGGWGRWEPHAGPASY